MNEKETFDLDFSLSALPKDLMNKASLFKKCVTENISCEFKKCISPKKLSNVYVVLDKNNKILEIEVNVSDDNTFKFNEILNKIYEKRNIEQIKSYDSKTDTLEHINTVRSFITEILHMLIDRISLHDSSKLEEPEKPIFDEMTPKLKNCTYGSDEYKEFLSIMKTALDHHYENNRHHPEHFENGINGMNLIDLIEMVCDWKAATLRHADGDILKSVEINSERFEISPQLKNIISNTIRDMNWEKRDNNE